MQKRFIVHNGPTTKNFTGALPDLAAQHQMSRACKDFRADIDVHTTTPRNLVQVISPTETHKTSMPPELRVLDIRPTVIVDCVPMAVWKEE